MPDDVLLLNALAEIRRRGSIGEASLPAAVEHARRFVARLPVGGGRLVDLGSGGGLPGLVIAVDRPELTVELVERRGARADQLQRAARALGLLTTTVHERDVATLVTDPAWCAQADVVTARSFGSVGLVARFAGALLRTGGVLLVSEPPDRPARWSPELLEGHGLVDDGELDGVRRLIRSDATPR